MAPEQTTQTVETPTFTTPPPATQPPPAQPFQSYQQYSQAYGYQPYQQHQQQQQQQVLGQNGAQLPPQQQQYAHQQQPAVVPLNRGWENTKIGLHAIDILFCIIALATTFSLIGKGGDYDFISLVCCPVLVVALIWDIAELITRCARKFKAGIHPGAHVALSLLIWMGAAIVGGIEATSAAYMDYDYSSNSNCENYNNDTHEYEDCDSSSSGSRPSMIVIATFTCLVWLAHFILFILACIDTSRRNAAARRPIMIVNGPPYWGPMAQGWQPMPQYFGGQPQGQYQQLPQQNVPLQTRSMSPAVVPEGKGKEPMHAPQMTEHAPQMGERASQEEAPREGRSEVREYYTPGGSGL
ncbi:hypothetical protein G7046_g1463 [Stylonectria norvegica]|nr:hypothetical protein G7046_g1463 [Stylonectria norvegica]